MTPKAFGKVSLRYEDLTPNGIPFVVVEEFEVFTEQELDNVFDWFQHPSFLICYFREKSMALPVSRIVRIETTIY